MELLYTKMTGESNFLTSVKKTVDNASDEVILVAHRVDKTYLGLVSDELLRAQERNVLVRLLLSSSHLDNTHHALVYLRDLLPRVNIRISDRIHAKLVVADRRWIVLGSANATGDGLGTGSEWTSQNHQWNQANFEVGIELEDITLGARLAALVDEHWNNSTAWTWQISSHPLLPSQSE